MKRFLGAISVFVLVYVLLGGLLDRVVFPEAEPGPQYYAGEGQSFVSRSEGFHQTVLKREGGRMWVELELEPHAPGPPEHIHTAFAENFIVAEGTLSLLVNGEKRLVRAGESLLVTPGIPHKPFNETGARVVVRPPLTAEYGMPEQFLVFLSQAYGFFDESESNRQLPRALLQMSRFSPRYDVWMAGPPVGIQKALFFAIGPTARLLGYRRQYDRYVPTR